jgi:uncharacterized protein with HEPN domain
VSRNTRLYLQDIVAACERLLTLSTGITDVSDFKSDATRWEAALWNLLVIGEAAKKIPADI